MKAPRHSSGSVRETNPDSQQISTRLLLLVVAFTGLVAISGCNTPPKDENGNLPNDVVRDFIGLVQADDYEAARDLWYGSSKRLTGPMRFENFCERFEGVDLDNCKTQTAPGKGDSWMVTIHWKENGDKKQYLLGLKIVDGEWKMPRGYQW